MVHGRGNKRSLDEYVVSAPHATISWYATGPWTSQRGQQPQIGRENTNAYVIQRVQLTCISLILPARPSCNSYQLFGRKSHIVDFHSPAVAKNFCSSFDMSSAMARFDAIRKGKEELSAPLKLCEIILQNAGQDIIEKDRLLGAMGSTGHACKTSKKCSWLRTRAWHLSTQKFSKIQRPLLSLQVRAGTRWLPILSEGILLAFSCRWMVILRPAWTMK